MKPLNRMQKTQISSVLLEEILEYNQQSPDRVDKLQDSLMEDSLLKSEDRNIMSPESPRQSPRQGYSPQRSTRFKQSGTKMLTDRTSMMQTLDSKRYKDSSLLGGIGRYQRRISNNAQEAIEMEVNLSNDNLDSFRIRESIESSKMENLKAHLATNYGAT